MVAGFAFGSEHVIEAAFGLGLAIALIVSALARARRRFRRRHPDVAKSWCALPRAVRKSIRKDIRQGRPIPSEYASITIESIDLSSKLRRAQKLNPRNKARRSLGPVCANVVLAGFLITTRDRPIVAIGVTLASFSATLVAVVAASLIHARHWDRYWPRRLIAARAQAERVLG